MAHEARETTGYGRPPVQGGVPRGFGRCGARALLAVALGTGLFGCGPDPTPGARDATADGTRPDAAPHDGEPGDLAADAAADAPESPDAGPPAATLDLVRPRIGSGGRGWGIGSVFVGASLPFGMVQLGPDTTGTGTDFPPYHCAGYYAADSRIRGFSQTHLHGTGIPALGAVALLPVVGPLAPGTRPRDLASAFDPASEDARPGRYAVTLTGPEREVELTATERTARHRYTFPPLGAGETASLVVDLGHALPSAGVRDAELTIAPESGEVSGFVHGTDGFTQKSGGIRTYFVARFDRPLTAFAAGAAPALEAGASLVAGPKTWAVLTFEVGPERTLGVAVGISYVSVAGARQNLAAEGGALDFETAAAAATAAWDEALSGVQFWGGSLAEREVMATALYHAFLMPNLFSDSDGRYLGFDNAVHTVPRGAAYTNFSLWDTYRNLHPLLTWLAPARERDMLASLVAMCTEGGYLPKWPLGNGYTNVMVGSPADIVVADSYLKGVRDFDVAAAYACMRATATGPVPDEHPYDGRRGIAEYLALGYVAADVTIESVSRTLEFAVADAAIANLAAARGNTADAAQFAAQAQHYRNLWDPDTQHFRGRNADGSWVSPFDPAEFQLWTGCCYTEGNAAQYRFFVPHDPDGLIALHGGPEPFVAHLQAFFEAGAAEVAAGIPADANDLALLLNPQRGYWHGNEPDIHAAYLFALAGRPDLTAHWLDWIRATLYRTDVEGLPGNDDAGTLSAFYIFSALGFYPLAGSDRYVLGKPLFPRAEVHLPGGTFVVEAPGLPVENGVVTAVTLDGVPVPGPYLRHGDLAPGRVLRFAVAPGGAGRSGR